MQRKNQSWKLLLPLKTFQGYMHGYQYSSIEFTLTGSELNPKQRAQLINWFSIQGIELDSKNNLSLYLNQAQDGFWSSTIELLLTCLNTLQQTANLGIYQSSKFSNITEHKAVITVPSWQRNFNVIIDLINWLVKVFSHYSNKDSDLNISPSLKEVTDKLQRNALKGSNRGKFIEAAFELKFPFIEMEYQAIQIGYGKQSIWLDGSFTSKTPVISSKLSKNKYITSSLLKRSGLPVAINKPVFNEQQALIAAKRIGFPLVIKPADLDGGIGITTNINNTKELIVAYKKASEYSQQILIEKHYQGRDYRITVLNGKSVWAVERIPGGVIGDGQHNIKELIDIQNQNPNRGNDGNPPLYPVYLDDEAIKQLHKQRLDTRFIPKNNQFIRLRSTANIASGGTPKVVFKEMHEDNKRLAERAAGVLRLDLAGVDLMIPDIKKSWLDTGAMICEVNAQPNIGQTTTAQLYPQILQTLVKSNGRIPIILILGNDPQLSHDLTDAYIDEGLNIGHFDGLCVYHNKNQITQSGVSCFIAGQSLLLNSEIDMIIYSGHSKELLKTGSPFPSYDLCVISTTEYSDKNEAYFSELLNVLIPACNGELIYTSTLPDINDEISIPKQKVEPSNLIHTIKQALSS
ncbi:hypothetical protein JCM30760_02550 [Thiomicrorhabdus hydrogeniphila]